MPSLSRRAQVLGQILKRIGNYGEMETFDDRLILQKTVYLLQAFGVYLGYRFSWYLYGPYSPELASDGYDLIPNYDEIEPVDFSSEEAEERFRLFLEFLGDEDRNPTWLEALASVHSLCKLYPERSKDEILDQVARKAPYFDHQLADQAWDYLRSQGMLSAQPAQEV